MAGEWRSYPPEGALRIDGGLDLRRNAAQVDDTEASDLLNVDLDEESVRSSWGAVKLNNQTAPKPGLRTTVDPAFSPLSIEAGRSVPLRGYGYLPYDADLDIGGDFVSSGSVPTETFHSRRGPKFALEVSFQIPSEEKLYEWETRGTNAPAVSGGDTFFEDNYGYDEATDECFCIIQKGGDRLQPMSWFLGVANVGGQTTDGSQTGFERTTGIAPGDRPSNYALVFGWFDAAGWNEQTTQDMQYSLTDPSDATPGLFSTVSYRSIVTKYFVVPGKTYHCSVQLKRDTAAMTDSAWNDDGFVQINVTEGLNNHWTGGWSAANLLDETEDLSQGEWTSTTTVKRRTDITPPIPGLKVWHVDDTSAIGTQSTLQDEAAASFTDNEDQTISCYVKNDDATQTTFSIEQPTGSVNTDGEIVWSTNTISVSDSAGQGTHTANLTAVAGTDGWYRMDVTLNYDSGGGGVVRFKLEPETFMSSSTGGVFVAGLMLEENTASTSTYEPNGDLYVWKGPTDSLEYLAKYGIRYSGRDPVYLGLGQRQAPWKDLGFIPMGADLAPLEHGGFVMVDRTDSTVTELYGAAVHTLTAAHTSTEAFLVFNHESLVTSNTNGAQSPVGPDGASWDGFDADAGGTNFNSTALRGYRAIWADDGVADNFAGGLLTLDTYTNADPEWQISLLGDTPTGLATVAARAVLIQCYRWHQRPLILSECRIYSDTRDYQDPRVRFSLRGEALLDDADEPGIANLLARWPLDDGGGGVLRESVRGVDGYLAPFGLGTSENGARGSNQLFLSGEGEALTLDLSDHPIFKREFLNNLASGSSGFAVELTGIFPEAVYGLDDNFTGTSYRAKFAPHLVSWEIKDPVNDGLQTNPEPLLLLTHRAQWETTAATATRRPMGFGLFVGDGSDQQNEGLQNIVPPWTGADGFFYDTNAKWVGKRVTIQVGIESTGTADTYHAYIAFLPKTDFVPVDGDGAGTEGAYYHTVKGQSLASATFRIEKKDLERSIITIGGCWDANALANGYTEASARMILDEVRVFATAAPGTLPATNGVEVTTRDGKIVSSKALPFRKLTADDILRPVGNGVATANVTENSTAVTTPGQSGFYDAEPEDTIEAVKETFLLVGGDTYESLEEETTGTQLREFYWVSGVSSNGDQIDLSTPYADNTRNNALARSFRLIGYTAFDDDIQDKPLTLGQGKTYVPGTSTTDDQPLTGSYFANLAPTDTAFVLRILSPLGSSSVAALLPGWVRGLQSPRKNPILGMTRINDRLLACGQGSLFEGDDRWRDDGPTSSLTKSLAFRSKALPQSDLLIPEAGDALIFEDAANVIIDAAADISSLTWGFDCWLYLDTYGAFQSEFWVGDPRTDPQLDAGTSEAHKIHMWMRLRDGRPQLCFGSTNTYDGTNKPEGGIFVSEAAAKLPLKTWTHVRWYLTETSSGATIEEPQCKINGKSVSVTAISVDNGSSSDWLLTAGLVDPDDFNSRIYVGVAPSSFRQADADRAFVIDKLRGDNLRADRHAGLMHSLGGRMADLVVFTAADTFGDSPADFDPHSIDYSSHTIKFRAQFQENVGHKAEDTGGTQFGVIHSHPCISLFHEMGHEGERVSFAAYQNEVFAANGGRVVVEEEGTARFAGVLVPTTTPAFTIEREPLWLPNKAAVDPEDNADTGIAADGDNDPVGAATEGEDEQYNHYSTFGNNYLDQLFQDEMTWEEDSSAVIDILAFKCYVRMRSVSGRILLWSMKNSLKSGKSLEIRDGKVGFYWWDMYRKEEVGVETSSPVIIPGYVHYIYFRKGWPQLDSAEGNWKNQQFLADAGNFNDMLVVRRFRKADSGNAWETDTTFDAKTDDTPNDGGTMSNVRNCISFTTSDTGTVSGTTATGLMTGLTNTYTGGAFPAKPGDITASVNAFHEDMKGMIWQWSDNTGVPAAIQGEVFRIKDVKSATGIVVVAENGTTSLDFSAITSLEGGVFSGINLVKSTNFDNSREPDDGGYNIAIMGHALQANPLTGIAPFNGEMWCPGWVSTSSGHIFENNAATSDNCQIGTDDFKDEVYNATGTPGPLRFDSADLFGAGGAGGDVFLCIDPAKATGGAEAGSVYVTTQPAEGETLIVAKDTDESSTNATDLVWTNAGSNETLNGTTQIYVTFYNPETNKQGNPSEKLTITPQGEDVSNPSGEARIVLTGIPVLPGMWRRIHMTLIDQENPVFRVLEIQDDTSTSVHLSFTQTEISNGVKEDTETQFFTHGTVRAKIVASGQGSIWYGNFPQLKQPDGFVASIPFQPHSIDFEAALVLDTGDDEEITGMVDHEGEMWVCKKNHITAVVSLYGQGSQRVVSDGLGAVSHQSLKVLDKALYGIGDQGPWTARGGSGPVYIGVKVEPYFDETIDPKHLPLISATINRRRNQYVFTTRRDGEDYTSERLALEFDHELSGRVAGLKRPALHRLTRYQDPNLTALAEVDNPRGGPRLLVGGTEEGFLVWLDRDDVKARMMIGPDLDIHGPISITINGTATTTFFPVDETQDVSLEGPRGARVRWRPTTTTDGVAVIAFATDRGLELDKATTLTVPADNAAATIGQLLRIWKSKRFDCATPHLMKLLQYINFSREDQSAGNLDINVYRDLSTTAFSFATAPPTIEIDLTDPTVEIFIGEAVEALRFQIEAVTVATDTAIEFELFDLVLRVQDVPRE